ncbi:MAG TPA: LysR family transcriptional regulator [Acidimicrobiales bacterium]|jgi:LysR family hydrogen peroxide-inducible transcriptional activator|nr:LysR family transcriptional regulator [Acidimicrobiales bacterium]
MDLRQLNALVAIAETGGFSAAADVLHTVQSNVSAHVARLEKELGVILVDRAAGRLTDEGEAVVARARRVAVELDGIVADVAAVNHAVAGTVRLGMIGTTGRWLVPRLLEVVAERHPGIHLVLVEGTTTTLEQQLTTGRLDLAVVNLPVPDRDVVIQPLFDEDIVLVVDRTHRLAERARIGLADLDGLDVLLPLPGTAFRDELDAACRAGKVVLKPKAEIDGVRLLASLTFEGHGPAILPATALPEWLGDRWRPVAVEGLPRRHIGVAQRRLGLPTAPARAVHTLVRELVDGEAELPLGVHPAA